MAFMAALLTARPISGDWKLRAHTRGRLKRLKTSARGALDGREQRQHVRWRAGVRVQRRGKLSGSVGGCMAGGRSVDGVVQRRNGATRPCPDPPRAAGRVASADQGRQVRASGSLVWRVRASFVGRR
jgi:hypothetical protein